MPFKGMQGRMMYGLHRELQLVSDLESFQLGSARGVRLFAEAWQAEPHPAFQSWDGRQVCRGALALSR